MGEFGKIVNKLCCSILDTLQWFSCRGSESSQEGVAVLQTEITSTWTRSCAASFVRKDWILQML